MKTKTVVVADHDRTASFSPPPGDVENAQQLPLIVDTSAYLHNNHREPKLETDEQQHSIVLQNLSSGSDEANNTLVNKETADEEMEDDGSRNQWGSKMDFLLSTIGFAVDLSNVFRFPYTCYRNGGGAFIIPYFVMLILGAVPMFYMELILGQYHRQGCLGIWKICPIFKGLGWTSCLLNFFVALYYNVAIAWALYYMINSFAWVLPWSLCNQSWNSHRCQLAVALNTTGGQNGTTQLRNATSSNLNVTFVSASMEYFERSVLSVHKSSGFHDIGPLKWDLAFYLFLVFVVLYFSLFKGVQSMGKAVWITAILPYIVLGVLLIRGVTLEGSGQGILYFLTPDFNKLLEAKVWSDAAIQIFFSIGVGFGVHVAYASYNPFHNNVLSDCLIATCVNSFTSIFSGLVVFSYLGYMSAKFSKSIEEVANEKYIVRLEPDTSGLRVQCPTTGPEGCTKE